MYSNTRFRKTSSFCKERKERQHENGLVIEEIRIASEVQVLFTVQKKDNYLISTGIKEVFEFDYIAVLQSSHNLQFSVL